jgi:hypothetical protein
MQSHKQALLFCAIQLAQFGVKKASPSAQEHPVQRAAWSIMDDENHTHPDARAFHAAVVNRTGFGARVFRLPWRMRSVQVQKFAEP